MKNEKGFTLVEILSVLIILGIIGVIVYPQVNKIIDKNSEKVVKEDVKGLVKSLDIYMSSNDYSDDMTSIDLSDKTIETLKGSKWETGFITNTENGYKFDQLYNGEYCLNGKNTDYTISKGKCVNVPEQCFEFYELSNTIAGYSFSKSCSRDLIIPEEINGAEVNVIYADAFRYHNLTSVVIPDTVHSIYRGAFGNNKLKEIHIPEDIQILYGLSFFINDLTEVVIPDTITTIYGQSFQHNNISKLTLPEGLEAINNYAFCFNNLKEITIPSTVNFLGLQSFFGNPLETIYMPGRTSNDLGTEWYEGNPTFIFSEE